MSWLPTSGTAYRGKPVLTWWQGPADLGAASGGTGYVYDDRYRQVAEVKGGNGYSADGQEFLITPWSTALIVARTITTANLTSIGGPAAEKVADSIVQEIEISTGKVLFQWNAAGHVPYQDSEQPRPASAARPGTGLIKGVHLDTDGNLLISARLAGAENKVSLHAGNIIWALGGKHSTFRLKAAPGQVLDLASHPSASPARPRGHRERRVHAVRRRVRRRQPRRTCLATAGWSPSGWTWPPRRPRW